jgi:hypothetical protein
MDTPTVLGVMSGLAGLFGLAVYIISIYKSDPKLILRMSNEDATGQTASIFGEERHIKFGISTRRDQPVLLTSVSLPVTYLDEVELLANDLFQPEVKAVDSGLSLTWTGEQPLQKKRFLMFEIPFKGHFTDQSAPFKINISATATVDPTTWRFPWSMFSPHKRKIDFTRLIQGKPTSPDNSGSWFRVGPGEACVIFGKTAKEAVHAKAEKLNVLVTEVFEDDRYKTSWIRNKDD